MILFFDTETNGLPVRGAPHERQPRLVQLGASLHDEVGKELVSLDLIIRPNGWVIPNQVAEVHGIDTELAEEAGIDLRYAIAPFLQMMSRANLIVAHNISFDLIIIRAALAELGMDPERLNEWSQHCTMRQAEPICKLPATPKQKAAGFGPYKQPKLSEAYEFFFGETLVGAHNAMVDVRACSRIYFHMKENYSG